VVGEQEITKVIVDHILDIGVHSQDAFSGITQLGWSFNSDWGDAGGSGQDVLGLELTDTNVFEAQHFGLSAY